MKRLRHSTITAVAVFVTALAVTSALAATPKPIVFTATYSGQASTNISGSTVAILANGTGKGTLIGAGKITGQGSGDSSQQPCIPFAGTGKMTGTAGTTIAFKLLSGASSCGDEGGHTFTVSGHAAVVKATGKLAKAKGTLKFTGVYSHDDGTFSVKFTGTLKK